MKRIICYFVAIAHLLFLSGCADNGPVDKFKKWLFEGEYDSETPITSDNPDLPDEPKTNYLLEISRYEIFDDSNGDGIIRPGEYAKFRVYIKNVGTKAYFSNTRFV